MSMTSEAVAVTRNGCVPASGWGGPDMLSRLGMLVFIVLPVVVVALGVAVAAVLALGWLIQHVIA